MEDVIAVASPFIAGILIVLIVFVSKIMRDKSKNQVIMKAIEHGAEISPELFKEQQKKPKDPLTSALVTIGVGISLFIALFLFFDYQLKFAAFGFIPLFIGLGQLTAYLINKKNKAKETIQE
ncbi:MAG: DUF6249 domain-containing protein [Bacteroidales bacterium]|jgi:amino acid transporter